jgi:cell volume regulation protein A
MTVSIAFAVIGAVILIGFFANLLFRATKIPSVLLLIGIGVTLGPVTGWITSNSLIGIAPFFGTLALLIILFEGGLELDIRSVVKQAPKAALLALLVFIFSTVSVACFSFFFLHMSLFHSLMIAAIFSAGSPAICLPVISGLSIKDEIKTMLKLESTLGDVLLIVTVLLVLDFHVTGNQSPTEMISRFFISLIVAFVIASIAGALWSRLIGWMGKEPLAYMLTLGFVFLLYFSVEELGGSAAMAVLIFGILLENMHVVAGGISLRMRYFFGINIREEQFILHEFMKNITEELSFLIRTFFFVYLGLILNFKSISIQIALSSTIIVVLLLASRWLGVQSIKKRCRFSVGETQIALSMIPRGLATAVMAFLPVQSGIPGTELLPTYAFTVIVLTNILMTAGIFAAERRLRRETGAESEIPKIIAPHTELLEQKIEAQPEESAAEVMLEESGPGWRALATTKESFKPFTFKGVMSQLFGILPEEREWRYIEAIKAASFAQPQFWVLIFFGAALTTLGLVINQSAIIIGAALIIPIAWPVIAAGMALAVGDIYLFLKLLAKLALVAALTALLAASFSGLLPFSAATAEIAARTKPTILDFMVAFFAGMAGSVMLFSKRKMLQLLPGAILAIVLLPPLSVIGFGLANRINIEIFRGGAVLFAANFFAAILGASLIYALVGMPEVAALKGIHDWKQRELAQPLVALIFTRLRLKNLAGKTGSVRSRMVVSAVFLLALVIPLQMAFNQLSHEFRARQAIAEVQKMFELPKRSVIINSASSIGDNSIAVRLHVATNSFFTNSDIRRFEERISDHTGMAARLDLVQSLSNLGESRKIGDILQPEPLASAKYGSSIPEITNNLRKEMERILPAIGLPQFIAILRIGTDLNFGQTLPGFRIEYLSDAPLHEDAKELLTNLLKNKMALTTEEIHLIHIPAKYMLSFNRKGEIAGMQESDGANIQAILNQYSHLLAKVKLPQNIDEQQKENIRTAIYRLLQSSEDSPRIEFSSNQNQERMATITLALPPEQPQPLNSAIKQ